MTNTRSTHTPLAECRNPQCANYTRNRRLIDLDEAPVPCCDAFCAMAFWLALSTPPQGRYIEPSSYDPTAYDELDIEAELPERFR